MTSTPGMAASGVNAAAVGGAVGGVMVLVLVAIVVLAVLVVWNHRRKTKAYNPAAQE